MLNQCLQCGINFKVVPAIAHKRKRCSRECRTKASRVKLKCDWCKKKFSEVLFRVKSNRGKYCSWECRRDAGSREIICKNCGKKVRRDKNQCNAKCQFCSPKCHYSYKYKTTKLRGMINNKCEHCAREFQINKYRHKEGKGRFCSKQCYKDGYVQNEDTKRLIRIARAKQILPTKNTIPELIMKGLLDRLGIRHEMQYYVCYGDNKRGGNFDFAIPDKELAIECDGVYWHRRDNNRAADQRKNEYCEKNGWILLRFTDTQITKNLHLCREKIMAVINNRKPSVPTLASV